MTLIVVILALAVICVYVLHRRKRRDRANACPRCGTALIGIRGTIVCTHCDQTHSWPEQVKQ